MKYSHELTMFYKQKILEYLKSLPQKADRQTLLTKLSSVESFVIWLKKNGLLKQKEFVKVMDFIARMKNKDQEKVVSNTDKIGSVEPRNNTIGNVNLRIFLYVSKIIAVIVVFILSYYFLTHAQSKITPPIYAEKTGRVLHYKGVLKDTEGNPVTYKTDVVFKLYNSEKTTAPVYVGSCLGEKAITPEYNGNFSIVIGESCEMRKIPDVIFSANNDLYLGITLGTDPEMQPRQRIPKVSYAVHSDNLKGLTLGTSTKSIPYIDENGRLLIDATSPLIESTSGNFTIRGESINLQTYQGKGGSIIINSDKDTIISTGNVGIGKYNPSVKLDVAGDASISGNLTFGNSYSNINILNGSDLIFNTSRLNENQLLSKMVLTSDGRLGIGTNSPKHFLTVEGTIPDGSTVSFSNKTNTDSVDSNVLRLNLNTADNSSKSTFIKFYNNNIAGDNSLVGQVRLHDGTVSYETKGADFAEYFDIKESVENGDIISITQDKPHKALQKEQLLGVVSNQAGFIGNSSDNNKGTIVGLIGQIETKVSTINGDISAGDPVTGSKLAGYGSKALEEGQIIGTALENSTDAKLSNQQCPIEYKDLNNKSNERIKCGKISIMVRVGWYKEDIFIGKTSDVEIIPNTSTQTAASDNYDSIKSALSSTEYVIRQSGRSIDNFLYATKILSASIQSGLIKTMDIIVENTLIAKKIFATSINSTLITTDNLISKNVTALLIKTDFLESKKITSPVIEADNIKTTNLQVKEINPVGNKLEIDLSNSESTQAGDFAELAIKGFNGDVVSTLDNRGNATFSATVTSDTVTAQEVNSTNLTSDTLSTRDASVSGQLYAEEIRAKNISSLEGSVSDLKSSIENTSSNVSRLELNSHDLNASLSQIKNEIQNLNPVKDSNPTYYQQISNIPNDATPSFDSVSLTGNTSAFDLNVINKFTTGNIVIQDNSILSLDWDLKINALSKINFFDGMVIISKDGSLITNGEIVANRGIKTDKLENISGDIKVKLAGNSVNDTKKIAFVNNKDEEVAYINDKGQANFSRIYMNNHIKEDQAERIITPEVNFQQNGVYAPGLITDNESAGIGIIPENSRELVIFNSAITDDSLIFVTPTTSIEGSLAVIEKETCNGNNTNVCKPFFKVSLDKNSLSKIEFNWLVIN